LGAVIFKFLPEPHNKLKHERLSFIILLSHTTVTSRMTLWRRWHNLTTDASEGSLILLYGHIMLLKILKISQQGILKFPTWKKIPLLQVHPYFFFRGMILETHL
jgi:hypothetical protein